ncbi:hypothetical protein ZWY2020_025968 [Hordeum vulgare]|nr:hypothetical protein ZWY2020_025968 [Hordeum vulgare]
MPERLSGLISGYAGLVDKVPSMKAFYCYAMDVNVERAEDVLTHKRILELAGDPVQRPSFALRAVQVQVGKKHICLSE